MSDMVLRKLETLVAQSPGDNDLKVRWIMEKNKMGQAKVETYYKIAHNSKYFSASSYSNPWTNTGSKFKTKHAAIKALDDALKSSNLGWRNAKGKKLSGTSLDKIKLVEFSTYVVERDVNVNFIEERTRSELEEINRQKKELKKKEEEILERSKKEREELLKKEQKLLRKINKKEK